MLLRTELSLLLTRLKLLISTYKCNEIIKKLFVMIQGSETTNCLISLD